MGGAKSKFEQTDWIRANGKLTKSEQTIDGSPPTSSYGVYIIKKTSLNQREFTMTDLNLNLLYTTRIVPGTLCWFDVYGNGIDDCRLRVQVDLSRRFWVVYRMGIPCFSGQFADRDATDKLANDRRENGDDLTATPFLFRRCCIAVSWSRYMAIAIQYGAPEGIDLASTQDLMDESLPAPMRKRGSEGSLILPLPRRDENDNDEEEKKGEDDNIPRLPQEEIASSSSSSSSPHLQEEQEGGNRTTEQNDDNDQQSEPQKLVFDASQESASSVHGGSTGSSGTEDDAEESQPTNALAAWVQKQAQLIKDNKKKQLKTDPLEGILHLDKPLLLCQEIYDKIIGNHQTSVLSRERAIELLREDLEHTKNDGEIDGNNHPFLADQEGIFAQIEELRRLEEEEKKAKEEAKKAKENKTKEDAEENAKPDNPKEEQEEELYANAPQVSTGPQHDANDGEHANDQGGETDSPKENEGDQQKGHDQASRQEQTDEGGHTDHQPKEEEINGQSQNDLLVQVNEEQLNDERPTDQQPQEDMQTKEEQVDGESHSAQKLKEDQDVDPCQNDGGLMEPKRSNGIHHDENRQSKLQTEATTNEVDGTSDKEQEGEEAPDTTETTASATEEEKSTEESKEEEDLVAYWLWENTWKTHQMKMHVAAGSDLALHVVMAIIVNQVRYERNAIAMTI